MRFVQDRLASLAKRLPWGPRKIARFVALYRTGLLWGHRQFLGVYKSFDDLPQKFPDDAIADHAAASAANPTLDNATGLPILQQDHSLLPVVAAMLGPPLRVLDFGGGAGIDFNNLCRAAKVEIANYTVVEMPALFAAGVRLWHADSRITFQTEMPHEGTFDLVYSWAAVYLHPSPLDLLRRFASYRPKAILLAHTPMTARRSFVRGQVRTTTFPSWVLSIPELEETMAELGYRIASQSATFDDCNVDGYAPEFHVPNCASVLILRK
jgi:putative methyltransferase (TIGR04325 family)